MKTSVALSWKTFASKLHPPLPVSPRDSQRLLSLLNASFKQQFDRHHLADSSSNDSHADLHLKSILTNPLFDAKPRTRASSSNKNQDVGKGLGQLQNHMKRPIDAFKERLCQGTANLETAKVFLTSQYRDCLSSPPATLKEALKSSGVAVPILQWLWSSGTEDRGEFLGDLAFIRLLVPFLVAEGQHTRILQWLHRYPDLDEILSIPHGIGTYNKQGFLFMLLINQELRFGDGLESAITLYLRIFTSLKSSWPTQRSVRNGAMRTTLFLTRTLVGLPKAAWPESNMIQSFSETLREFQSNTEIRAYIHVFFEKCPNPWSALTYLQNIPATTLANMAVKRRPHVALLGLRAAELFLQHGRRSEALWIVDFLQTNFAEDIGSPLAQARRCFARNKQEKLLSREEQSLRLLDELAVQ